MTRVAVLGSFDNFSSRHVRFLDEAARLGEVIVHLLSDADHMRLTGEPPKFAEQERRYLLEAMRFVRHVTLTNGLPELDALPADADVWVVEESQANARKRDFARAHGIELCAIPDASLRQFPAWSAPAEFSAARRKVMVTGCYDWLHSGHVWFFEECAAHGDLYVVVGHDANLRLLKGEGHPLFPQEERRYVVSAVRHVREALISTGAGWLDAAPEIERVRPDIYAVNDDGDKPEKRDFCRQHGIEYLVLHRAPKPGLTNRTSTDLRGF